MGRIVAWWQWLLIGTGFFLLDMVLGPAVVKSGHRAFAILTLSLLASIISVCLVIGAIRCAKWFWCLEAINNQLADTEVGAISQHLLDSILGSDALHLIPRNKRPVAPSGYRRSA
jgi:signal transduction histidine kinase